MRPEDPLSLRARLDAVLESARGRAGYWEAQEAAMTFALDLAERVLAERPARTLVGAMLAGRATAAARACVATGFERAAVSEAERVAAPLLAVPGAPSWLYPAVNVNDPAGAARAALALAEDAGLTLEVEAGVLSIGTRTR